MSAFMFKPAQKILFIGDSITDCGRLTDSTAPHGTGYVYFVRNLLLARYPRHGLTVENRGISGNTVRDLKARWQADVIAEKPDVLSVKIGVNDVWRHIAGLPADHVPLEEYEATYRQLLAETRDKIGPKLILVDPFLAETNPKDPFRAMIDRYIQCVHKLAGEFGAVSVRTQQAFDELLKHQPVSYCCADDRVHPNPVGHMLIARTFLRAVGYDL